MDNINTNHIPTELKNIIDSEKIDFIIDSKKKNNPKNFVGLIGFAIFWNAVVLMFAAAFFVPLFTKGEVHFKVNKAPVTATLEHWQPMIVPFLVVCFFGSIGIVMIWFAVRSISAKGGYFIGTPTRLIQHRKGTIISTNWEQFSGNMEINLKGQTGSIELQLKSGIRGSKGKFIPDTIFISNITNILEVEKRCRYRINENNLKEIIS